MKFWPAFARRSTQFSVAVWPKYCNNNNYYISNNCTINDNPGFQLISSDEAVWPGYRLARREEVEGNMEEVQIAITDEWAIVELEDGEISGL